MAQYSNGAARRIAACLCSLPAAASWPARQGDATVSAVRAASSGAARADARELSALAADDSAAADGSARAVRHGAAAAASGAAGIPARARAVGASPSRRSKKHRGSRGRASWKLDPHPPVPAGRRPLPVGERQSAKLFLLDVNGLGGGRVLLFEPHIFLTRSRGRSTGVSSRNFYVRYFTNAIDDIT